LRPSTGSFKILGYFQQFWDFFYLLQFFLIVSI
jgi:hypothetical protein